VCDFEWRGPASFGNVQNSNSAKGTETSRSARYRRHALLHYLIIFLRNICKLDRSEPIIRRPLIAIRRNPGATGTPSRPSPPISTEDIQSPPCINRFPAPSRALHNTMSSPSSSRPHNEMPSLGHVDGMRKRSSRGTRRFRTCSISRAYRAILQLAINAEERRRDVMIPRRARSLAIAAFFLDVVRPCGCSFSLEQNSFML
jgi:hypothetical protein